MSTYLITRPTAVPAIRRAVAFAPRRTTGFLPAALSPVDVTRDGEDGLVTVEAPGLDPAADLSVAVTGNQLTVAGTRRSTAGGVTREARFSRTLTLADGLGQDAVSADYTAGVLRVRVAGMFPTPVQPETHAVAITSDVKAVAAVAVETTDEQAEAPAAA